MFRNYITVALRSIFREKLTATINILGLALAMTSALLIYLFITDELGFDDHHSKSDRIYRITRSFHSADGDVSLHLANVAPPIGPLLKNDFGQIEALARTVNFGMVINLEQNGEIKLSNNEDRVFLAEPALFEIFDVSMISGDQKAALIKPFSVMLSEQTARRYFNTTDIIGKTLRGNNAFDLEVTGVYEDFPRQSHWHPEFIISFSTLEDDNVYGRNALETNWGNNSFGTYMVLSSADDAARIQEQLPAFMDRHFGNFVRSQANASPDFKASKVTSLYLQKVTDIHLHSHLDDELEVNGNINNVYMMAVIGIFIVLIACFNFINLSTARAMKRTKEVCLRKVVGAFKQQLVTQYLSESVLIALFAVILAVGFTLLAINWLNDFTGKSLSLNVSENILLYGGVLLLAIVVGILAGIYPAFVVSSFNPATSLKGKGSSSTKGGLRKVLVVFQFAVSIVLIIATIITVQQLDYLNDRNLGYNKDQIVTLPYYNELTPVYDAFYNEVTTLSSIEEIGRSSRIPTGRLLDSYGNARILKNDSLVATSVSLKTIANDETFFETYDVSMAAGRNFSKDIITDDSLAFIVNESAAKAFGWENFEDYIDKEFTYAGTRGKLIGVVKDFHFESLHQQIAPMVFLQREQNYNFLSVKIPQATMQEGIAKLETVWKTFLPARPFEYTFLSARYGNLYTAERKESQLFTLFSCLAIFIASLGLFGLATFSTLQRIKEIGIRKVLGSSVGGILMLLSKEIVVLILIANLLAWPVAWYFMSAWLNSFAYHVPVNVWAFVIAAISTLLLSLLTVSTQTVRAATTNPVNTIRHE